MKESSSITQEKLDSIQGKQFLTKDFIDTDYDMLLTRWRLFLSPVIE